MGCFAEQSGRNLPRIWSRCVCVCVCVYIYIYICILGAKLLWPINFVGWRQIFVGPQYRICLMSPLWLLDFWEIYVFLFWMNLLPPSILHGLNDHPFCSARVKRLHLDAVSLSSLSKWSLCQLSGVPDLEQPTSVCPSVCAVVSAINPLGRLSRNSV